jgi:MazG family protein
MDTPPADRDFPGLVAIMNELREKCPWDKKQTIHSLRQQTIEELYELADAITNEHWDGIKEELGDLLLHIVFYARIASEKGKFTIEDVISGICEKLISRHPHIYGNVTVSGSEEVKRNWENLKLKEGKTSVLSGVPVSLPALVKAMRLQEKARQTGFDWENAGQVMEKVVEELSELEEMIQCGDAGKAAAEYGDLLFSLVNYGRFLKIDAENALELTNLKFIRRFCQMELLAAKQGKRISDMTLQEMDHLWNAVKSAET